jgi:hypothetical protein
MLVLLPAHPLQLPRITVCSLPSLLHCLLLGPNARSTSTVHSTSGCLGLLSLGRGSMQWPLLSRLSPSPAGTSLYRSSALLSACCSPLAHPAVQPVFGRWRDRRDRVCVPGFRVCRRRYKGCPRVQRNRLRGDMFLSPARRNPWPYLRAWARWIMFLFVALL